MLAARSLCAVLVDSGWHLRLRVHWIIALSLLDCVGIGARALQHGLQDFLIPHQKVQLTGLAVRLQQLLRLFFGVMLGIDLEVLEQIDELRVDLPILALCALDRL